MFIEFDGTIINTNAISQVMAVKENNEYIIRIFRMDGSYMASEKYAEPKKSIDRFTEIKNILIKEN